MFQDDIPKTNVCLNRMNISASFELNNLEVELDVA